MHTNSNLTSQDAHYVSGTKIIQLMLYRETAAVYYENNMKHTNIFCGQNAEI
jgi:hypothetical protein